FAGVGLDGQVSALALDNTGNLYAGGFFTTADGVAVNHIARWNGTSWAALGSGVNSTVRALALDGAGNLYAGGAVTTADGPAPSSIEICTVSRRDALRSSFGGVGLDRDVSALALDGAGNLYAGGVFTTAGGVVANNIARWNGTSWAALGSGMDSYVSALALD